jgi:hypothetical protein
VVAKTFRPALAIAAFIVGFVAVGVLHVFLLGPTASEHPTDVIGRNLFLTDSTVGIVLAFLGICLIVIRGFNFTSALVLSCGLSIGVFWVLEALAFMG